MRICFFWGEGQNVALYVKDLRRFHKELAKGCGQISTFLELKPRAVNRGTKCPPVNAIENRGLVVRNCRLSVDSSGRKQVKLLQPVTV